MDISATDDKEYYINKINNYLDRFISSNEENKNKLITFTLFKNHNPIAIDCKGRKVIFLDRVNDLERLSNDELNYICASFSYSNTEIKNSIYEIIPSVTGNHCYVTPYIYSVEEFEKICSNDKGSTMSEYLKMLLNAILKPWQGTNFLLRYNWIDNNTDIIHSCIEIDTDKCTFYLMGGYSTYDYSLIENEILDDYKSIYEGCDVFNLETNSSPCYITFRFNDNTKANLEEIKKDGKFTFPIKLKL